PPAPLQPDLVPGAEVAGAAERVTDVAEIAGDVAGRDVLASSESYGQMLEVAADTDSLGEDVHCCLRGSCRHVVESNLLVNPVADGGGARPAWREAPTEILRYLAKTIDLAISAKTQKPRHLIRKV